MAGRSETVRNDITIPGFKTRHLVEMRAAGWAELLSFVDWVKDQGHIAYFRTNPVKGGELAVALGVEGVGGERLRTALNTHEGIVAPQIEHLLMNEQSR